ncbi:hypothetical protein [Hyphomicrobium sp. MC1]
MIYSHTHGDHWGGCAALSRKQMCDPGKFP